MHHQKNKTLEGIISITSKGTGYVATSEDKKKGNDPEIAFEDLNTALHGDMVEIILNPRGKASGVKNRTTGKVVKIISRAKNGFVGVLQKIDPSTPLKKSQDGSLRVKNISYFLKPDDPKMYTDIAIKDGTLHGAKVGDKVFVKITLWKSSADLPEGHIVKTLGRPGANDTEMHAIAIEKGFEAELPEKVESEAREIKKHGIQKSDLVGRKDFRDTLTFTIDPYDAKDFDDAISFKEVGKDLYEVGIHIADVSHYVRPGSAIDHEARERGTSVYLVDRTIPMLPEVLSNDLCSLVPDKDRLTMSAVFVLDKNANVKSEWYGKSIIHSKKRFTYEEAEISIKKPGSPLHRELHILNDLAKKMTKDRFAHGAISLEQEEVKFVLDKDGTPIKVIKKERGDSNKLIEEFMLLANKKVAEILSPKNKEDKENNFSLYRVHDLPSLEKTADLAFFLRSLGHKVTLRDGNIPPHELNKLLASLSGKTEGDVVYRAVIRSMAKAVYSTKNIGHYGLAFKYYTHFTSPIRRYPDILIHRLLQKHLTEKNKKHQNIKEKIAEYEKMARIASEQEKRASDAERASIKYKQVEYMSKRVGEVFKGIVSGVTEWGIYVEEIETKCEGMVRVKDMQDDFYIFNEKNLELVGQKKKKKYRLGDHVKIKVRGVDQEKKTIDYILA